MDKNELKIVFFGTPAFAVESLDRLVKGGYNIAAVVTAPDKPAGRGHRLLQSDVKKYAVEHNLPLLQPEKLKAEEFVNALREIDADLFIVIAFRMLPEVVWAMPRLGTFNLHASLLPKYRGAAPINWAVINGDQVTGVTTFFLKHEIDTGDIIDQESIAIAPDECVGSVHDRLMTLGAELTVKTVDAILRGDLTTTPQDQLLGDALPTPAPKIFKDTCHIDWSLPGSQIYNLIRGLSPYPAAWTELAIGDEPPISVKITGADSTTITSLRPGEIRVDNNRLIVGTSDNALSITQLQPAGRKSMAAADFLRGVRFTATPRFI